MGGLKLFLLAGLGLMMAGLSQTGSAQSLAIDWIVSEPELHASTVERAFDHQVRWDFLIEARQVVRSSADVLGKGSGKLAPPNTLFYAVRSRETTFCTLASAGDREYQSRRKRICLIDSDRDGTLDRFALGEYRRSLDQTIKIDGFGTLVKADVVPLASPQEARELDGTMFVTSRVRGRLSMELFIDGQSLMRDCYLKNQVIAEDDSATFECGIPGLNINVQNTSQGRKSRRVELEIPTEAFAVQFNGLSGVSFF